MSGLGRVRTVFAKEFVDHVRDRRALLSTLLYVLLGPVLLLGVIFMSGRVFASETSRAIDLPVIGADRAPSLIAYLRQRNITPLPTQDSAERMIRQQHRPAVLLVSPDYISDLQRGRPATVQLFHDSSQRADLSAVERIRDALYGYGLSMGHLRLLARGIDPHIVNGLAVESADLATPYSRAAMLFSIVPILLLMSLFVGGMYVAIDTTAGERERGSLEPLLINPVTPLEIMAGKFGAVATFTAGTAMLSLLGFALALNLTPVEIPEVRLGLSATGLLWVVLILLPLVLFVAALQLRLASQARTFKEAQSATQLLTLLPALPGLIQLFGSADLDKVRWLPVFGQHLLVECVLRHERIVLLDYGLVTLFTMTLGVGVFADTVRRWDGEKVLFG